MRNNHLRRAAMSLRNILPLGLFLVAGAARAMSGQEDDSVAVLAPTIILPPTQEDYGDWKVDIRQQVIFAYTSNELHNRFGVACGSTCVAFVQPPEACREEKSSPIMINGSIGAYLIDGPCRTVKGMTVLLVEYSGPLRGTVEAGGRISLGFPIADAKFSATRYSLTGATKAIQRAEDLAEERKKRGDQLFDFPL